MTDKQAGTGRSGASSADLAIDLVPILASRMRPGPAPSEIAAVVSAAKSGDRGALSAAVSEMILRGTTTRFLIEVLIPAAARELGREWSADVSSFATVTTASSRLQSILRDLAPPLPGRGPGALVLIRRGRQHTLGAIVAASVLRFHGVQAELCCGRPDPEAVQMARDGGYDMIALSVPFGSDLEADAAFVASLRRAAPGVPIAVGGGAVEGSEETSRIALGADFATTDIAEAARLCGLIEAAPVALRFATGGGR
ncbi:MAG: cobalamin B12-binding domain-containing protein [Hasllibacter sp.]